MVSVRYGPFNPYIPIRSTTIGKSRVATDPIAMHTSWRSNSDIASLLVQADEGTLLLVVDLIRRNLPPPTVKSQSPCDSGWSQAPRRQQVLSVGHRDVAVVKASEKF
ncbi:hypothetical protein F511_41578 [Dorcoceras hygrometricum]|uniref:Uncharacterized protein n=1 Tax=Dorcoceras hygrometricum TaxID=472368 RepID=A0A2Z7DBT6_9LAMI|nr:hypothetical protein F511_41578 [Dorcoceras hygrometricum]